MAYKTFVDYLDELKDAEQRTHLEAKAMREFVEHELSEVPSLNRDQFVSALRRRAQALLSIVAIYTYFYDFEEM